MLGFHRIVIVAAASVLLAGCVTQTQRPDQSFAESALPPRVIENGGAPSAPNRSAGQFADVDSCAGRLQDIGGQLVLYYSLYNQLPARLDDLRAAASVGEVSDYACPVSHEPYVYVPGGLVRPGDERRLYLFDASPAHGGMRWGLVFAPKHGRQPPLADVIKIPEPWMKQYVPAAPLPAATKPAGQ